MYFPYLRGKQFELLALRELIGLLLDSNKIIPIVEPVKRSTTGLKAAFYKLKDRNIRIQLIINPEIGDLRGNAEYIIEFIEKEHHLCCRQWVRLSVSVKK